MELLLEKCVSSDSQQGSSDVACHIDAAFYIPGCQGLVLNVAGWSKNIAGFLAHAIARTPNDLRCHVQRINFFISKKDEENLYGSLLDLFIILADRGYPLRKRMLNAARPLLRKDYYQTLQQHIDNGLTVNNGVVGSRTSVLSSRLASPPRLIERADAKKTTIRDPLEEAHDHLEYGQVDAARQVLEAAINETPDRHELYQELLGIYKCTNDQERYQTMREQLEVGDSPVLQSWLALADSLGTER